MTRKRSRPTPNEVRCPQCQSVAWRRAGERVAEAATSDGGSYLRHEFAEGGPWEWTCEVCGYEVRPTGRLDNALGRVQTPVQPGGTIAVGGLLNELYQRLRASARSVGSAGGGATAAATLVTAMVVAANVSRSDEGPGHGPSPAIARPSDGSSLASTGLREGARVEWSDVQVDRVTGDATFWVTVGEGRVLVVLDERGHVDANLVIRPDQRLAISGTARDDPPGNIRLSEPDLAQVAAADRFVVADTVRVVSD
jgi:hypothetical protein